MLPNDDEIASQELPNYFSEIGLGVRKFAAMPVPRVSKELIELFHHAIYGIKVSTLLRVINIHLLATRKYR